MRSKSIARRVAARGMFLSLILCLLLCDKIPGQIIVIQIAFPIEKVISLRS